MGSTQQQPQLTSFRLLDDDSLLQIFEELRPGRHLRPLSLTCKWIRELCRPVLFRECSVMIIPHEAVFAGVVMDDVGGGTPQSLWGLEEYHLAAARVIALRLGPRLEEVHVMPLHADLVWRRYLVTRSSERGAIDVSFDCITANLLPP